MSPAPAPPPAPTRAVVLRVEGFGSASKPIVLDRAAAYVLDQSVSNDGPIRSAEGSLSDARLVAEVRQVVDAHHGISSRELSGTVRSELLLRSDLAFQNATLTPVELRFDRRLSVALSPLSLAVAAGQRVWLPAPLAGGSARVQWRPLPEPDEAPRGGAVKIGAIQRGDGARGSLPDLPDASEYGWSDPVSLRTLAAAAAAVTDSDDRPEPPHATAASRWGSRATGSGSFRCIVTAHHSPKATASVVALAPPLYLTNSLPVSVSVSVGSGSAGSETSPDRVGASSRAEHRKCRGDSLTVAPGATVAVHDGAVDASSTVNVQVRPAGYTNCPAVAVPVMPRTKHGDEAEGAVWSARREVFFADDGTGRLARRVSVSLKIEATVDEHGARRVRVSCPTSAVNRSTDPLVLQQVRPPRPNTFGKGDAASLGLAGSDLRGWAKRRRDRESRVKTPGEGDCWLPAATEVVTLADASGGEVVRGGSCSSPPRRSHGPGPRRRRRSGSRRCRRRGC